MGLPFWMSTAPNPFLLASVCNVDVSFLEKYGRVIFFWNSSFISQNAFSCIAVGLYYTSLASNSRSGVHRSANLGEYLFRKFTSPRKLCIVSLSPGNSMFRIEFIFFGSGEIPFADQTCPKNDTVSFLNCSLSLFSLSPFFHVVSRKRMRFLSCSSSFLP